MEIVAALFVESFNFRQVAGPSTRIDLTGAYFSIAFPSFPTRHEPHLMVLLRCPPGHPGAGTLETKVTRDGEQIAFNRQDFTIEPGKFGYRLVKVDVDFPEPGTIEAVCSTGTGPVVTVPLTALLAQA
jgi:hypothetical protein